MNTFRHDASLGIPGIPWPNASNSTREDAIQSSYEHQDWVSKNQHRSDFDDLHKATWEKVEDHRGMPIWRRK